MFAVSSNFGATVINAKPIYPVDSRGYVDTRGAAKYLGLSETKLAKDRHFGVGAEFTKFGRAVRYSYAALDAWAEQNRRTGTQEAA